MEIEFRIIINGLDSTRFDSPCGQFGEKEIGWITKGEIEEREKKKKKKIEERKGGKGVPARREPEAECRASTCLPWDNRERA